jgi:hypothetical protein
VEEPVTPEQSCSHEEQVEEQQRRQASLEEIVGELVLQNVGLQRALRRSRSLGRPRDSVDSSSDCEQRSPRQRQRAQRLARMCALRQQQENLQRRDWQESFLHKWQCDNSQDLEIPSNKIESFEPQSEPQSEPQFEPKLQTEELNLSYEPPSTITTPESPAHSSEGSYRSGSLLGVFASLGSRLRVNSTETLSESEQVPSFQVPTMYKQGSSGLGARIAQSSSCEYADPQTLLRRSDEDFYEESLAAALEKEETFRDSAIFSDEHEETTDLPLPQPVKVPPPVPAKPKPSSPAKAVWRTMEAPKPHFCNQLPERGKDFSTLNCAIPRSNGYKPWVKNSNSADNLLNEIKPLNVKFASVSNCHPTSVHSPPEETTEFLEVHPKPKGWVKHVVGKLQASTDSS